MFTSSDADAWFARNKDRLEAKASDPLIEALKPLAPQSIAEIGCANGWRIAEMQRLWGAHVTGIDPSPAAITAGYREHGLPITVGRADSLPWINEIVDCVAFGFCLYLCKRADLLKIASEADRVLRPGGYIAIYDFYPQTAHSRPYAHREGVMSHKMDYSTLWSWHPHYRLWSHTVCAHEGKSPDDPDETLAVTILKKFPLPG